MGGACGLQGFAAGGRSSGYTPLKCQKEGFILPVPPFILEVLILGKGGGWEWG